jgi:glutaredoxin 3
MAKSFLAANTISYQDINVAEDRAARDEMVRATGVMAVPVIEVDGEFLIGFDEAALREKLGLQQG